MIMIGRQSPIAGPAAALSSSWRIPAPRTSRTRRTIMDLKPDFTFRPLPPVAEPDHLPFPDIPNPLGPLVYLPGTWTGTGFNTIWRPFHTGDVRRFLELNLTDETIEFSVIGGGIPNRGLLQPDLIMFGVHYLQQISDANVPGNP